MPPVAQSPEVVNIINVLNTHLKWKNVNGAPRGYQKYHPSSFGGCLRKAQYQRYEEQGLFKCEKEDIDPKTVRIFDTGHSMHARWSSYFEQIGVLRGVWECANPCCHLWDEDGNYSPDILQRDGLKVTEVIANFKPRIYGLLDKIGCFKPKYCICGNKEFHYHEVTVSDKELNFHGHCDQILDFSNFDPSIYKTGNPVDILFKMEDLPKKPIVLDMKSINDFSFKSKLNEGPSLIYRTQLVIYCNILDLEYGVLIYENKNDSATKIYKIEKDVEMWNVIRKQALALNNMNSDQLLPPPRPTSKEDFDCRYCEYQSICHKSKIWQDPDLMQKRLKFYGILK